MRTRTLLLAALAPALALGGCGGTQNRGLESVHQPVVERTDYALDLAAGPNGLAPGELARLSGWFHSIALGYGDQVTVDGGTYPAETVRDDVARQAASFGLLLAGDPPVTPVPIEPGTVRVVVSRMRASVPGCPDHSRVSGIEFEGNTQSNYGCATNSNLAAMVANPADLVRGEQGTRVGDPRQSGKAIDTFRRAAPSGQGGTVKSESVGGK